MSFQRPLQAAWVNCPRSCSPTQHFAACSETLIGDRVSNPAPPTKIRLDRIVAHETLFPLGRLASGSGARVARHRGRSSFCAVSLTQLKSGLALSPGDRFWRGSLHASSLFSYEAVQNGEKNSRTRQKVLMQYIMGPRTPLVGCRGVWWPWLGGPGPWGVVP